MPTGISPYSDENWLHENELDLTPECGPIPFPPKGWPLGFVPAVNDEWWHRFVDPSKPVTWVTVYTRDMGNTFGAKGSSIGFSRQACSSKYPRS